MRGLTVCCVVSLLAFVCVGGSSLAADRAEVAAAQARLAAEYAGVEFFAEAGRITRVYGPAFGSGATAIEAAEGFRLNHAAVFGAEHGDLVPGGPLFEGRRIQPVMFDPETGEYKFVLAYYSQERDGVPVFEADLRVLMRDDPGYAVVLAASTLRDLGNFRPQPVPGGVRADLARAQANAILPDLVNFGEVQTVIWAGPLDKAVEPTLAVTFIADNYGSPDAEKPQRWLFVADAATGEILYAQDKIIFTDITGNVSGKATEGPKSDTCANEVPTPMPYARVTVSGGATGYTDEDGNFDITHSGTSPVSVSSYMAGTYFTVDNNQGSEETLTVTVTPGVPYNFMHNSDNTNEFVRSQVNGYVQANIVRDWVLTYNPSYPTIAGQTNFPVSVNRTDSLYCPGNAWYDGSSLNFCSSGSGYPNTAYSGVLHHEYGHHVVEMGGSGQDEYGEGMGDCHSMLIANDPILGYGFLGDCYSGIRTADNNCQYSASSCSTCGSEIHDCGQLLSGCVWDVRLELETTEPADYLDIVSNLTVNSVLLHSGGSIESDIAVDFLTLDDDDGNIANGTPHYFEICTGFEAHGLNCPELETGLSVSPDTGLASGGPSGGPFTPGSQLYTLENLGPGAISYQVTKSASWLTITNPSGSLPSVGSTAQVTVSINSGAGSLPDGSYSDTVYFINTTDHVGDTARQVTLSIGFPDACSSAVVACPGVYSDTTVGMTNDGSASCGGSTPTPDVWYKYTPLTSGSLTLLLCDSDYDTVVSVHTGCPGTSANEVGCNDDSGWFSPCNWLPTQQSVLENVPVTAGHTYLIRVSGYNGATGNYVLEVSGPACAPTETCNDGIRNQGEDRIDCGGPCPPCDCLSDGVCSDGAYCTGQETCDAYGHCQDGTYPCTAGQWCDEDDNLCRSLCEAQAARSCADHGAAGTLCLEVGVAGGVEPRFSGVSELKIDLDYASGFSGGTAVTCVNAGDVSGSVSGTSVAGSTVTVAFEPGLPDQDACTVELDCGASVCIRGLKGDVDLGGLVTPGDASIIKPHFGAVPDASSARFDVDVSGLVTPGDFSQVKPLFTHGVPACP